MVENVKFRYLEVIGILTVVFGHSNVDLFFRNLFPYYSFHTALFFFISGYFFPSKYKPTSFIWSKIKRLLVPYFVWNVVYGVFLSAIFYLGLTQIFEPLNFDNLFINPFIHVGNYLFNLAGWFAASLFIVYVIYVCLRKLFRIQSFKGECFFTILCFCLGIIGTSIRMIDNYFYLIFIRTFFGLFFIQFGRLYSLKLEKYDRFTVRNIIAVIIIQSILLLVFGYGKLEYLLVDGKFNDAILPFVTSLTGIWFWLQISDLLSRVGEYRIIKYLGENTYTIMLHHIFAFWLLNTIFYATNIQGFNVEGYMTEIFYKFNPSGVQPFYYVYAAFGVFLPLLCKYTYKKIVAH